MKINEKFNIWEEKYRPQTIEDIILPSEYKQQFIEFTKQEMLPNMLFVSSVPGTGKCLDYDEEIEVFIKGEKNKLKIGDLFKFLNIQKVDEVEPSKDIFIKTPNGNLTEIRGFIKKSPKNIYKYILENGIILKCSDEHLVQENGITKKIKDCKYVDTINGKLKIIKSEFIKKDYVYDISIDYPHLYVTPNGIIHHNTTLVKSIINETQPSIKWINASQDNNVSTIRHEIVGFASTISAEGKKKLIILDEADNLTTSSTGMAGAQDILRGVIEQYANNTRFILTANYKERFIEPLLSRLKVYDFDEMFMTHKKELAKQMYKRLIFICENENIEYDKKDLQEIIKINYPSMRNMIQMLQQNVFEGKLVLKNKKVNTIFKEILDAVFKKDFNETRKLVMDTSNPSSFYSWFWKNIFEKLPDKVKPEIAVRLAYYLELDRNSKNKSITLMGFLSELMSKV